MTSHAAPEVSPAPILAGKATLIIGGSETPALPLATAAYAEGARVIVAEPASSLRMGDAREPSATTGHTGNRSPGAPAAVADSLVRIPCSLDDEHDVDDLFDRVASRPDRLDLVLACIDVEALPAVHELSLTRWRACATDPLRSAFWIARRGAEEFLAEGTPGRIVFLLTMGRQDGPMNEVVRDGLTSLARSFAREYGRRGMAMNLLVEAASSAAASSPQALIRQALFLCSTESSFVNGEVIVSSGRPTAPAWEETLAR